MADLFRPDGVAVSLRRAGATKSERLAEKYFGLREAAAKGLMILTAFAIAGAGTLLYRTNFPPGQRDLREYEGRVVDKSATFRETEIGSRVKRRILVEGKDGRRFEISPVPEVYERAEVGMMIRSGAAGTEVYWPGSGQRQQRPAAEGSGR